MTTVVRTSPTKGLRAFLRRRVDGVLQPLGLDLMAFRYEPDSGIITPRIVERVNAALADTIHGFLRDALSSVVSYGRDQVLADVVTYRQLMANPRVKQSWGGSGFNAGLWLYVLCRAVDPKLIVESGSFKGFSSWVLETAQRQGEMHCFDVTFARLQYRSPKIHYHETDWMDVDLAVKPGEAALAFFDDHQSQCDRVMELHQRGFKFLLFDDNLPIDRIFDDGWPPIPTIDMVMDTDLRDGETIEWTFKGGRQSYVHDAAKVDRCRGLIRAARRLPPLGGVGGYLNANLTVVVL